MLIHINRKIFNGLKVDLRKDYIEDILIAQDIEDIKLIEYLVNGLMYIIHKNEEVIEKYGMESYIKEDYPASEYISGYYHSTGKYIIVPFDWSAVDGEFDYSFQIAKLIDKDEI